MTEFSSWLDSKMKEYGITEQELAEITPHSRSTIHRVRAGKVTPRQETIDNIFLALAQYIATQPVDYQRYYEIDNIDVPNFITNVVLFILTAGVLTHLIIYLSTTL